MFVVVFVVDGGDGGGGFWGDFLHMVCYLQTFGKFREI